MSDLQKATEICCEYLAKRPGIRSRLHEQTDAGMKAQSLEQTTNVISNPDRDEEEKGGPRVTDVTGEAAIRTDRARRLLAELDQAEGDLLLAANRLIGHPMTNFSNLVTVIVRHGVLFERDIKGAARVFDRALGEVLGRKRPDPGKSHDGREYCQSCARLKEGEWFSEPNYNRGRPTDLAGALRTKVRLCRTCERFCAGLAQQGLKVRLPTVDELRYFRREGKWPRIYAKAS